MSLTDDILMHYGIVFRGMVPVPAFIELFGGFFYELVQLIQVDICEYGRNDAALRAA